jgi:hypothetical protein
MKQPLNPTPIRRDLTDRELTRAIGGLLGGLSGMCDLQELRNAVRWWADTDDAWEFMAYNKNLETSSFNNDNNTGVD